MFGEQCDPTAANPLPTDRTYTGQEQDGTGLMYFRARYMDPALGTFVSPDTMVPDVGVIFDHNRYMYVRGNALKYNDPSGHWIESALDLAFIAYDIYDIKTNGLTRQSGLSLAADVVGLLLPGFTGGGPLVRSAIHADGVFDTARAAGHLGSGAQAVVTASRLRQVGTHTDEGVRLAKALAEQSTHGRGSRVVIGKWVEGAGYVAEANKNGGIYYETAEGVWDALGKSDDLAWAANEQFLRSQLESGIDRIDLVGESVTEILSNATGSFRWKEVTWLRDHAIEYGYELVGNSWVKAAP